MIWNDVLDPMLGHNVCVKVLCDRLDVVGRFSLSSADFKNKLEVLPHCLQEDGEHLALPLEEAEHRILHE